MREKSYTVTTLVITCTPVYKNMCACISVCAYEWCICINHYPFPTSTFVKAVLYCIYIEKKLFLWQQPLTTIEYKYHNDNEVLMSRFKKFLLYIKTTKKREKNFQMLCVSMFRLTYIFYVFVFVQQQQQWRKPQLFLQHFCYMKTLCTVKNYYYYYKYHNCYYNYYIYVCINRYIGCVR